MDNHRPFIRQVELDARSGTIIGGRSKRLAVCSEMGRSDSGWKDTNTLSQIIRRISGLATKTRLQTMHFSRRLTAEPPSVLAATRARLESRRRYQHVGSARGV